MIATSAVLLSLLASTSAFPTIKRQASNETATPAVRERLFEGIEPTVDLVWRPCNETQEIPYQCALLSVPLDYQKPDNGLRAVLPIVKYPTNATGPDYKGSVFFNPGGPGYLSTEPIYNPGFVTGVVENITGPGYDIIGVDIRGVGYSIPYAACNLDPMMDPIEPLRQNATQLDLSSYKNLKQRSPENGDTGLGDPYESAYGFYLPRIPLELHISDSALYGQQIANACVPTIGGYNQAGTHMNTAVTATDMLMVAKQIARLQGQEESNVLVNYYGISYGTVLGQTFATMYPQNVGKFLLDGVVDMTGWQARTEFNIFRHTDEGFDNFFTLCSEAGPELCAFHTGSTPEDIKSRFNNMTLRFNPEPFADTPDIVVALTMGNRLLKSKILDALYDALNQFPGLAVLLAALDEATSGPFLQWNITEITEVLLLPLTTPSPNPRPLAPLQRITHSFYQTACGDAAPLFGVNITDAGEIEAWRKVSVIAGHLRNADRIVCSQYTIRPTWEWHETIGGQTATLILFVGNTLDPVTPWEDARTASEKFVGAGYFVVDLIAHAMFSSENECAYEKTRAYFQTGTLPQLGSTCEYSRKPFN